MLSTSTDIDIDSNMSLASNKTSQSFWAWQLKIPAELPGLLKNFTKAVLKDKPENLIHYGSLYFNNLLRQQDSESENSDEKTPETKQINGFLNSTKDKLQWSDIEKFMKNFESLRKENESESTIKVPYVKLDKVWDEMGLSKIQLSELMSLGSYYTGYVPLLNFTALLCSSISKSYGEALFNVIELWKNLQMDAFEEVAKSLSSLDEEQPVELMDSIVIQLYEVESIKNTNVVTFDESFKEIFQVE